VFETSDVEDFVSSGFYVEFRHAVGACVERFSWKCGRVYEDRRLVKRFPTTLIGALEFCVAMEV